MATQDTNLTASRIPLIGLLVVQLLVSYEWLMSGHIRQLERSLT